MTSYAARRIFGLIPVLIGVTLLIFTITRLIPGDPAVAMLGQRSSPELRAQLRADLGLDQPVWLNFAAVSEGKGIGALFDSQYFDYMGDLLRGDLGRSIFSRIPVAESLTRRFPATFELTLAAMLFALVVGIPAGVWAALNRGKLADTAVMTFALSGVSFPVFWLAIILIYVFAVELGWLPPSGRLSSASDLEPITGLYVIDSILRLNGEALLDTLRHLVLPAIALGTIPLAYRCAHDQEFDARGPKSGLRPHRPLQGFARAPGRQQTRLPQRPAPRRHRHRTQLRLAPLGRNPYRDGLLVARYWSLGVRRYLGSRLSHHPRWHHLRGTYLHARKLAG